MKIKYRIPGIPPSMNKYKGRSNVWEYRRDKKAWEELIGWYCRPRPDKPVPKCRLTLTYYFANRNRHDPNNYDGQFITDGLVKAGILADDSFACIELFLRGGYDKENPRTEIEITYKEEKYGDKQDRFGGDRGAGSVSDWVQDTQ